MNQYHTCIFHEKKIKKLIIHKTYLWAIQDKYLALEQVCVSVCNHSELEISRWLHMQAGSTGTHSVKK